MTNPALYVLARPSFTNEFSRFLETENLTWVSDDASAAERLVEFSGRICYLAFGARQSPKKNRDYIRNLIANGHESVLEHVCWTFLLTNVSRSFTHQLVRHRIGFSFSQLSQQYHDESDAVFLMPEGIENIPDAIEAWRAATSSSLEAYRAILSKLETGSISKENLRSIRTAARSVLPNATEAKIVVTANARAIRHFLNVRGAIEGDLEMRRVSELIYLMVNSDAPALVQDFNVVPLSDGTPSVEKESLE